MWQECDCWLYFIFMNKSQVYIFQYMFKVFYLQLLHVHALAISFRDQFTTIPILWRCKSWPLHFSSHFAPAWLITIWTSYVLATHAIFHILNFKFSHLIITHTWGLKNTSSCNIQRILYYEICIETSAIRQILQFLVLNKIHLHLDMFQFTN